MNTPIKDLFRLNRHSDTLVVLHYANIIFEPLEIDEEFDFNEFGGESAASFLGMEDFS